MYSSLALHSRPCSHADEHRRKQNKEVESLERESRYGGAEHPSLQAQLIDVGIEDIVWDPWTSFFLSCAVESFGTLEHLHV